MREPVKLVVVLTVISLIAGGALAYTYQTTKPRIDANAAKSQQEALAQVLPGTTGFTTVTLAGREVYECTDSSKTVTGLAFVAESAGFSGFIRVMVGLDVPSGKVAGISILSQSETPGLGARVAEPAFAKQFAGKPVGDAFEAKADVQAITGATISTKAVAQGIKNGASAILAAYGKEGESK